MELSFQDELTMVLRLLLATGLGAIIGYQRERTRKPAGFRTHMLIAMGAVVFTLASIYGFGGAPSDPARVAANIVTGIGFLGAGAILHPTEGIVAGLTTAASMWATAAIGLAVGSGLYVLSVVATILALIVLMLPHPIRG